MIERRLVMLPGPTNVPDRVMNAMLQPMVDHRGADFHVLYSEIEANLKYVFQTENDVFILTSSGTGGVECAVTNLINEGEKVVVPVFGEFSERLAEKIRRRGGVPIEIVLPWGTAPKASEIKEIVEKEQNVKAIFLVYNETSTGVTVRELPQVGKIAEENNLLLVVDAVSILGGDKLPVDEWKIDVCITGSQKCLACPPGLAMVSVSQKAWDKIEKIGKKPIYFDLLEMRKSASRSETPFTPALPLFYALNEALKLVKEEGLERRIERHRRCAKAFYEAINAMGMTAFPREEENRSNTVIAVNVPEKGDDRKVREIMREKYKVLIAGGIGKLKGRIFRIGCMGIISQAEVVMTINALGNALKEVGCHVNIEGGLEAAMKAFQ
ncbi:MAG: alanine--glyoxylate aminotransferase family protein [Candidatus Bathyarchaeota archaeon]|nr:alanine--glyoxylate aminotransferase family protein [Candidatus Bathyarchaeota archaeon]MDW8040402.1 alanine--glyoxylate aminotransferase family protein [Nitrososphaerota archaeon]